MVRPADRSSNEMNGKLEKQDGSGGAVIDSLWQLPRFRLLPHISLAVILEMDVNELKKRAAVEAVKQVRSGDIVGLGTGSTAYFAVEELGRLLREGVLKDVVGVATSLETETHVRDSALG